MYERVVMVVVLTAAMAVTLLTLTKGVSWI